MKRKAPALIFMYLLAAAWPTASCNEVDGTETVGDADACSSNSHVVITDDTNYTFSSALSIQSPVVKDATNLTFDWGGLTRDMFGRPVDAVNDINLVLISLWNMPESAITESLKQDELPLQSNLGALTSYPAAFTSAQLMDFNSFGTAVAPDEVWSRFDTSTPNYAYAADSHTFMVMAATGTIPGKNTKMLSFFRLDPNSSNTRISLTDNSTTLQYSVNLQSLKPVPVPEGKADLTIDWSKMTRNALGNPYDGTQITKAVVAHYSSMSLEELEMQFLNLETLADSWWQAEVLSGTSIHLNALQDNSASPFAGIDANGVWIVGLFCDVNCNNPAPWSITVLVPCS